MDLANRRGRVAAALALVGIGAAGCTGTTAGSGTYHFTPVPNAHLDIEDLPSDGPTHSDVIAANAISDIQDYWSDQMTETFEMDYEPVSGGIFSIDPDDPPDELPCGADITDIEFNAFYCPALGPDDDDGDLVAYDRGGLLPELSDSYNDFLIAMVLAHEFGHAIQARVDFRASRTIVSETQADCYSGAWTKAAVLGRSGHFQPTLRVLDKALSGFLEFRDPVGTSSDERGSHGNGFDRISAFQEGYEQGPGHCAEFDDSRQFTEVEFSSPDDASNNGDLPYDDIVGAATDIGEYWEDTFGQLGDGEFTAPSELTPFDSDDPPTCGDAPITVPVRYCAEDQTVYFDDAAMREVYDGTGDYGPMTILAMAYAQAVLDAQGESIDGDAAFTQEVCLAGAYTGAVAANGAASGAQLSPGDLDEAIGTMLGYAGDEFGQKDTSGFERVSDFRRGLAGPESC